MKRSMIETNLATIADHFRLELTHVEAAVQSYTVDAVWESPARQLSYQGKDTIGRNYHAMASSLSDLEIYPIDRFATADRVTDDTIVKFTLTGNGFKNAPVPIGSKVELRLVHIFEMRGGKIAREKVFELWRVFEGHGG